MGRTIVAACALIRKENFFLIAKDRLENIWGFPTWRVEPGEDIRGGLEREIKEEFSIDVSVESEFSVIRYADRAGNEMYYHGFLCRFIAGDPRPRIHGDAHWVAIKDFAHYEFIVALIPIVRQLEFKFGSEVPAFLLGTKSQHLAAARMVIETLQKSLRGRGVPDGEIELECPRCREVIGIVTDGALPEKMVLHELARCSIKHPPN